MNVITKSIQLPDGRTITIETGKVAKQADGSVMLRMNNTVLLATVCAAKDAVPGTDFMPLQVDYREQYAAYRQMVSISLMHWQVLQHQPRWHVQISPSSVLSPRFAWLVSMASMSSTPPSNR